MRRREFILALGGAAAFAPLAAHAQQPAMPVIGFLSGRSSAESQYLVAAFSKGLRETGFVEGRDFAIEFRWADGQYDRLPAQAADLAGRPVSLIVAVGAVPAIRAAKRATATIPIVFVTGDDPVRLGLVASLNKPGGNVTGVSPLTTQLEAKRLAILHELVARNAVIAFLVNPNSPSAEIESKQAEAAAADKCGYPIFPLGETHMSKRSTGFTGRSQQRGGVCACRTKAVGGNRVTGRRGVPWRMRRLRRKPYFFVLTSILRQKLASY